jgi:hypothetical protein
MSAEWINALAMLNTTPATEFEDVFDATVRPCDATAAPAPSSACGSIALS